MVTSTERTKLWRKSNPERWRELQQQYRKRNRKGCRSCGAELPFPSMGTKYCVICITAHRQQQGKKHRDKTQSEFDAFKLNLGCYICKYNKCSAALDFHHLDPNEKERRVTARMWKNNLGKAEFDKCVLVCKNCHMEIHHNDKKIQENGDVY